jgi:hypothetical protein
LASLRGHDQPTVLGTREICDGALDLANVADIYWAYLNSKKWPRQIELHRAGQFQPAMQDHEEWLLSSRQEQPP